MKTIEIYNWSGKSFSNAKNTKNNYFQPFFEGYKEYTNYPLIHTLIKNRIVKPLLIGLHNIYYDNLFIYIKMAVFLILHLKKRV